MGSGAGGRLRSQPWRIALVYVAIGVAWILGSDFLVETLLPESAWASAQAYKGIVYILITGLALLLMLRSYRSRVEKVHEELAVTSKRYREFFDQSLAGAFELDRRGYLVAANSAFRSLLELRKSDSMGPFGACLADQDQWQRLWGGVVSGGDVESEMVEFRVAEGVVRRCEMRLYGIREGGQLMGVRGFLVDHTALLELRESMTQRERLEAVGRLAGGVAHDFNNILTAIMGYSEWLEAMLVSDPQAQEAVQGLKKSAEKAGAITRQLLVFSAKNRGPAQVIDVNEAVGGMSPVLQRLLGERVRFETGMWKEPLRVRMDPAQFDQMILNLVVNARDATPERGMVSVSVRSEVLNRESGRKAGVEGGEYVVVSVTDTGVGMTPEVLAHAFEPFFTTKASGKGTGLGLSTVFGAAKAAGGFVTADSTVGRGTVFRVFLPKVEPSPESREMAKLEPVSIAERGSGGVLVVEDHEEVREMMVHVLSSEGFEVVDVSDGRGLDEMKAGVRVDLAIIDMNLPTEKGTEVAVRVRAKWPEAEVLFMSGHRRDSDALADLLGPADRLLEKPFTPSKLINTVHGILSADRRQAQ